MQYNHPTSSFKVAETMSIEWYYGNRTIEEVDKSMGF